MSARVSMAPGSRRGLGMLSSSQNLSSSQSAGTSSQPAFTFRPHVLLSQGGGDDDKAGSSKPLLDYSDLNQRIEIFREVFLASTEQTIAELERKAAENASRMREETRRLESTKDAIERQREEQDRLHQTIASEKQADSSAQAQLSKLQNSLASLEQRLTEAEKERNRLKLNLDKKLEDRDKRKARLLNEVRRNRPELLRFNEKLGCRVSAGGGSEKAGGRGKSTIKFTFNLINPDDWSYEAKFVIDASKSDYKILSHSPTIPQEKLDTLLSDLNSSRALFTFIKRMRSAFKEVVEKQRVAQRAARRDC